MLMLILIVVSLMMCSAAIIFAFLFFNQQKTLQNTEYNLKYVAGFSYNVLLKYDELLRLIEMEKQTTEEFSKVSFELFENVNLLNEVLFELVMPFMNEEESKQFLLVNPELVNQLKEKNKKNMDNEKETKK